VRTFLITVTPDVHRPRRHLMVNEVVAGRA
jgi:hypothetical protein